MQDAYRLSELAIFHDLTPQEITQFLEQMEARIEQYEHGARLLRAYTSNSNIGFVLKGEGQVVVEDCLGNESVGHRIKRGSMLGASTAILAPITLPIDIEALTAMDVLWIEYDWLVTKGPRLGRIHGIVMRNILEAFCRRNVRMMQKLEIISQKGIRERVILYLMQQELLQPGLHRIEVPGRIQLARELECNRSALTREISLMQKDGLLTVGEGWMSLNHEKISEGRR